MDMQNLEKSNSSINRLEQAVDELVKVISEQRQNFQTALAAEKNSGAQAKAKITELEEQIKNLQNEKQKLQADLSAARDNTENENRIKQLQSLVDSRAGEIGNLRSEIQKLSSALNEQKVQLEEAEKQKLALEQQLEGVKAKAIELEQAKSSENLAISELQQRLDATVREKEALAQQCDDLQQKLTTMQKTITQTTDNIDNVVARLEKVLEENGTGSNNN